MNLHGIVAPIIGVVNPPIVGQWKASTGYTTAADGTQVPSYAAPVDITLDVQALSAKEIEHLDGLNIQGMMKGVWANGEIHGIDRTAGLGGDILTFSGQTWLVVQVLEAWNGDWCHVAVSRQRS